LRIAKPEDKSQLGFSGIHFHLLNLYLGVIEFNDFVRGTLARGTTCIFCDWLRNSLLGLRLHLVDLFLSHLDLLDFIATNSKRGVDEPENVLAEI